MTVYTVHFRNSTAWASHDIKAKTPEQALARARKLQADDSLDLWFEPYDLTSEVNEIVVSDEGGDELAFWHDEELTLRLAAQDLLEALEDLLGDRPSVQGGVCQHCGRDYIHEFIEGECTSDDCAGVKARAAIAKAKGGAA